jgi:hypothetical protein
LYDAELNEESALTNELGIESEGIEGAELLTQLFELVGVFDDYI